jgi:hypothetical protein
MPYSSHQKLQKAKAQALISRANVLEKSQRLNPTFICAQSANTVTISQPTATPHNRIFYRRNQQIGSGIFQLDADRCGEIPRRRQ